jgi:hypothetical protein
MNEQETKNMTDAKEVHEYLDWYAERVRFFKDALREIRLMLIEEITFRRMRGPQC